MLLAILTMDTTLAVVAVTVSIMPVMITKVGMNMVVTVISTVSIEMTALNGYEQLQRSKLLLVRLQL